VPHAMVEQREKLGFTTAEQPFYNDRFACVFFFCVERDGERGSPRNRVFGDNINLLT